MPLTLGELARKVNAELRGDPERAIAGVATLQSAEADSISFLANPQYRKYLGQTRAGAVILAPEYAAECPVPVLVSGNPYATYARVAALLSPLSAGKRGMHPTASVSAASKVHDSAWVGPHCVLDSGVVIGADCYIGPGCIIGPGVSIGAGSRLVARVTVLQGSVIGERAVIHPGVVIGSDGFGLAKDEGRWIKVPQLGGVRIGNDVEIGANTTIDRGALDDTVLEDGVKLDNQIQIAHNVHVGAHTAIAGCVGISGSARIGRNCMIAGGVGIVGHLEIADDVVVTGFSMVTKSITKPGVYSSGLPVQPNEQWNRNSARFRHLDELARRLHRLEQRLKNED